MDFHLFIQKFNEKFVGSHLDFNDAEVKDFAARHGVLAVREWDAEGGEGMEKGGILFFHQATAPYVYLSDGPGTDTCWTDSVNCDNGPDPYKLSW